MRKTGAKWHWSCCLAITSVTLLLSGCLETTMAVTPDLVTPTTDKIPNWVLSPPQDSSHLYGVGSAPRIDNIALSFAQAEQNGNAQIAQQLRTQVSQINIQNTQVSNTTGQPEQVTRIQSAYTQVKTPQIELEQAVNEARFAGKDVVYALQSIDRNRIVSKLKLTMQDIDEAIQQQASQLSSKSGTSPREQDWHTYMRLIPLFAKRKETYRELALYDQHVSAFLHSDPAISTLETQTSEALSEFGFDTTNTSFPQALNSTLSTFGLTPKVHSTFQLTSQTSQHSQTQDGRFYVFEEGTLSLLDSAGNQLGTWTASGRGISTDKSAAIQQAKADWSHQAIQGMFHWLTGQ